MTQAFHPGPVIWCRIEPIKCAHGNGHGGGCTTMAGWELEYLNHPGVKLPLCDVHIEKLCVDVGIERPK